MKKDYTHLSLVVDRSGSMGTIKEDAQGGVNTLISEQAAVETGNITVSLYEFDNRYDKVFGPVAASEAPEYVLSPRGSTALHDSIFKAMADTGDWLRELDEAERPSKVIFTIVTDGGENASREVKLDQLKAAITEQTDKYDWEFVYLAANVDAFATGGGMGIKGTTGFVQTRIKDSYYTLSNAVTNSRATGAAVADMMPAEIKDEDTTTTTTTTT